MPRQLVKRWPLGLAAAVLAVGIPLGVVLASHQFSDVPYASPFHNDIAAVADAGVSGGCGGGRFCPKDNVTREQMAAFLNRLGALAPGKPPVVNAATLEGRDASAFMPLGDPAPVGSAQYGSWAIATSQNFPGLTSISFPAVAPKIPLAQVVQYGAGPTSACPGSASAPAARAGYLCIYVGWNKQQAGHPEPVLVYDPTDGSGGASRFGAVVYIVDSTDDADQYAEASGTWAFTASTTALAAPADDKTAQRGALP